MHRSRVYPRRGTCELLCNSVYGNVDFMNTQKLPHSQNVLISLFGLVIIITSFQTLSKSRFQQWRRHQSRWKPMTRNVQCVINCSLTPNCSHAVISYVVTVWCAGYCPKPRHAALFAAVSSWIQRSEPVGKAWRTSLTVFPPTWPWRRWWKASSC